MIAENSYACAVCLELTVKSDITAWFHDNLWLADIKYLYACMQGLLAFSPTAELMQAHPSFVSSSIFVVMCIN